MKPCWHYACLTICLAASTVHSHTEWVHQRLTVALADPHYRFHAFVSPSGVPVYEALTEMGVNVFVGTRNISLEVLGRYHGAASAGVTEDGLPIWHDRLYSRLFVGTEVFATKVFDVPSPQRAVGGQISYAKSVGGRLKVFVNDTDITTAALGESGEGKLPSPPSPSGIVAWTGKGSGTDGYWDMFRGTENISSFLGSGRIAEFGRVDDAGHVLWVGKAPSTGNRNKVFLDRRDLSSEVFGPSGWGGPRGMNRRGDVLWEGGSAFNNVMLNTTSVSYPVVGGSINVMGHGLSENGHVLWYASGGTLVGHLFRDYVDLTGTVLGPDFSSGGGGRINSSGNVLWSGIHPQTDHGGVFYDSFNLSRDALGADILMGGELAIGDGGHYGGHCLWSWKTGPSKYEIWLSTPIPEPSAALAVPLALGLLTVVRRRLNPSYFSGDLRE